MGRRLEGVRGRWKSIRGWWWLLFWSWSLVSYFLFVLGDECVCGEEYVSLRRVKNGLFVMMMIRFFLGWVDRWCFENVEKRESSWVFTKNLKKIAIGRLVNLDFFDLFNFEKVKNFLLNIKKTLSKDSV